jgi:hypothetical protein
MVRGFTYGLGTGNQNLPGFVVMCPGGYPIQESQNWQSGFLPEFFRAPTSTRNTRGSRSSSSISKTTSPRRASNRSNWNCCRRSNERHLKKHQQDAQLEARIQSFELAYRMQMDATDAFDITREPEPIRKMYGEGTQARQLLIARRLVEKGVRFVQVWHGSGSRGTTMMTLR